jgi:sarcosine oxidase subunit gamma
MPKLAYRSPLAGTVEPLAIPALQTPGARLLEKPQQGIIELQGDPAEAAFLGAVKSVLNLDLPTVPCTASQGPVWRALWSRPQGWLLVGPIAQTAATTAALEGACAGLHATAVDVSHRAVTWELSGPAARTILAKGCPLDLHPKSFKAGQCTRTILAGQSVFLDAVNDTPTFDLMLDQSLARSMWAWFRTAMGIA